MVDDDTSHLEFWLNGVVIFAISLLGLTGMMGTNFLGLTSRCGVKPPRPSQLRMLETGPLG
jgi:hypothetical protein